MAKSISKMYERGFRIYEFISTSVHEAGHTVYALLNCTQISSVSVFANKKAKRVHGLTCYDYPGDFDLIEDKELLNNLLTAEIGISYAGLIAEKMLFESMSGSKQTPMFIIDGSTDDNKAARDFIAKYNLAPPGIKRATYKRKLMKQIRDDLDNHWDAVMLIAHALFKHRRLAFEDLQALLTKKSANKKFWKEQFKKINYYYNNKHNLDEREIKVIFSR